MWYRGLIFGFLLLFLIGCAGTTTTQAVTPQQIPELGEAIYGEPFNCDPEENLWMYVWFHDTYGEYRGEYYVTYTSFVLLGAADDTPFLIVEFSQDYEMTPLHTWVYGQHMTPEKFQENYNGDACELLRKRYRGVTV